MQGVFEYGHDADSRYALYAPTHADVSTELQIIWSTTSLEPPRPAWNRRVGPHWRAISAHAAWPMFVPACAPFRAQLPRPRSGGVHPPPPPPPPPAHGGRPPPPPHPGGGRHPVDVQYGVQPPGHADGPGRNGLKPPWNPRPCTLSEPRESAKPMLLLARAMSGMAVSIALPSSASAASQSGDGGPAAGWRPRLPGAPSRCRATASGTRPVRGSTTT